MQTMNTTHTAISAVNVYDVGYCVVSNTLHHKC